MSFSERLIRFADSVRLEEGGPRSRRVLSRLRTFFAVPFFPCVALYVNACSVT